MRIRIQYPLFAAFLGVIGLLLVLIVLLVSSGLRRELGLTVREDLERQLALGEWVVQEAGLVDLDSLAREITDRIGYRVTFIDPEGGVLGDSYVELGRLPEVENHYDRPEVQGVLVGGETVSFAERTSETVAEPLLYAARLITLDGSSVIMRIAAPQTDIERTVSGVQRTVALTGLLAMLFALAAAYMISIALTKPLVLLAKRARQFSKGDYTVRVPDTKVTELQDVADAFNLLTDELQSRLTELGHEREEMQTLIDCMAEGVIALSEDARVIRMNRSARELLELPDTPDFAPINSVVSDNKLRSVLEDSVIRPGNSDEVEVNGRHLLVSSRALDPGGAVTTLLDISEIRRLEQVRRDFVANASHELKTPLTSIRGYAETLLDDDPPEKLKLEFLTSIRKNTLRLEHLVEDLLDLSKLESGGWTGRRESVDTKDVAQEAWQVVRDIEGKEGISFDILGDLRVMGDREGLFHVFRNLLENSIRHTDSGGSINVSMALTQDSMVEVVISDDGDGIPAESLPRIFERFYRADSARARDFGGTGLGLAIVRHLVSEMGGEVVAESQLGQGTTVRFTVPTE
jgi:two-component system phosphate regulon sensor histidine kinase PhoR|tara:strand:+ start:9235 stop:10962 length:1728 start_codon:yes stop_codon:yes gene_type:complete